MKYKNRYLTHDDFGAKFYGLGQSILGDFFAVHLPQLGASSRPGRCSATAGYIDRRVDRIFGSVLYGPFQGWPRKPPSRSTIATESLTANGA